MKKLYILLISFFMAFTSYAGCGGCGSSKSHDHDHSQGKECCSSGESCCKDCDDEKSKDNLEN